MSSEGTTTQAAAAPEQPQQAEQQQQQQQQQKAPKKPKQGSSKSSKTLPELFNERFGELDFEYIDTHVHIPFVLEKMTSQLAKLRKPAAASADAQDPEAEAAPAAAPAAEVTWPQLAASLPGNFAGCVVVCCEPESFESSMAVLNLDRGLADAPPALTVPAADAASAVVVTDGSTTAPRAGNLGRMVGAFGIHPHEASKWSPEVQAQFESAMSHPHVVAWGECGLDYFYDNSPRDKQKVVFAEQMALAVKHKKPLVVHTRDAEEDTIVLMKQHLPADWIVHIHCCTSSRAMIEPLMEYFPNLYVGFTGVITFPTAANVRDTLDAVPLERLLLETDGPFMAPLPFRGAVAHPGHVPFTAEKMAEVKGVPVAEVFAAVRKNTRAVYGI